MATYIVLLNWTDQGIRDVKDTINRAKAFRQAAQTMGVEIRDIHWTIGPYDAISTFDAPDDETATRLGLALGMKGNVRSTTLRAFGEQEMERIIQGLP